jgi:hypothetical protein
MVLMPTTRQGVTHKDGLLATGSGDETIKVGGLNVTLAA